MTYAVGEYYEHADEYDLEYQSQSEQDLPFWKELVMRYLPQRALELACGSGRIGLELLRGPGDFLLEGVDIRGRCWRRTSASWPARRRASSNAQRFTRAICAIISCPTKASLT